MITDTILADHVAGRDLMTAIGNAAQQATEERHAALVRFAGLWREHGRRLDAIDREAPPAPGDPLAALQRRVSDDADGLADAGGREEPDFLPRLAELKRRFESQCEIEETGLLPRLQALPPDRLAALAAA